jgi:hypothetical protein
MEGSVGIFTAVLTAQANLLLADSKTRTSTIGRDLLTLLHTYHSYDPSP